MAGDGFEAAFLPHYVYEIGFSKSDAAFLGTIYGVLAAVSAWSSGVVAEVITPQKTMCIGFLLWIIMHVLFMVFGIGYHNYPAMVAFYGIRGIGFSLFFYSFIIVIVNNVDKVKISIAMGWYWTVYSFGFGVVGGFLPGYTNRVIGENGTLWMAIIWVAIGGLIALFGLKKAKVNREKANLPLNEKCKELSQAITILFKNKNVFMCALIRIINTTPLFGFAIIMPFLLCGNGVKEPGLGFSNTEWQNLWTLFLFVTIFTNALWGIMGNYIGWLRQIRWVGCIGGAIACALFYYIPVTYGHNMWMAMIPAIFFGITVAGFVPLTAVLTALEPNHKGAVISIYNLSAGLSQAVGSLIPTIMLQTSFGILGTIYVYIALYLFAVILTFLVKVKQPKQGEEELSQDMNVQSVNIA